MAGRTLPAETSCKLIGENPIIPLSRLVDDIVYDSVLFCLLRVHNEVAFHILLYLLELLTAVLSQQLIRNLTHTQDFAGMDVDIRSLPRESPHRRLMDENPRIGQSQPLLRFSRR